MPYSSRSLITQQKQEVETPDWIKKLVVHHWGKYWDPCPYPRPKGFDSLKMKKWKKFNYINPPYNNIGAFVKKSIEQLKKYGYTSVFLIPARLGQTWFLKYVWGKYEVIPFRGAIRFKGYKLAFPQTMMLVVISKDSDPNRHRAVLRPIDVGQLKLKRKVTRSEAKKFPGMIVGA